MSPPGSPVITHSSHKMASLSWSSTFLPAPVPHSPVSVPNLSSHSHLYRPMFCLLSHSDSNPQSTLHYCWFVYNHLRMFQMIGLFVACCSLYFISWVLSDSSSQLTKDARSSSQDAARPTELWVCRACTESPVEAELGQRRGPTITKTSYLLSTLTGGFMRAVIQVNVYHCPPLMPHTGTLCISNVRVISRLRIFVWLSGGGPGLCGHVIFLCHPTRGKL